ncbi:hypothetical protein E4U54_001286 [Claviceps lovelessii]|nr:hypothetical protein E4U54_001286 [Claviceps lovelessii]
MADDGVSDRDCDEENDAEEDVETNGADIRDTVNSTWKMMETIMKKIVQSMVLTQFVNTKQDENTEVM